MKAPLSKIPLLPVAISLAAGIVLGAAYGSWTAIAALVAAIAAAVARRQLAAMCLLSVAAGIADWALNAPAQLSKSQGAGKEMVYTGVVSRCREGQTSRSITVDTKSATCILTTPSMLPRVSPGDIITFKARLEEPTVTADVPDEFTMDSYYKANNISATAFVPPGDLSVTGRDNSLRWRLDRFRQRLADTILLSPLNDATAAFLCATLLGDRSHLDEDTTLEFSTAGVAHVLALSGMHVAIITLILSAALMPLTIATGKRAGRVVIVVLLWVYAVMTGLSASTVRAVIMATMLLGGHLLERPASGGNSLCFAAIAIMLCVPRQLFDPGFQLSFAAVAALLALSGWLSELPVRRGWLRWLIATATAPVAATAATGIIAAAYFHRFPVYFMLANIPVVMLLPWFVGGGCLMVAIAVVAPGCYPQWLTWSLDGLYGAIDSIAGLSASLPGAAITGIYPTVWAIGAVAAAIVSLIIWSASRRHVWLAAAALAIAAAYPSQVATTPRFPQNEIFVTRHSYRTDLLLREGHEARLLTTAPRPDRPDALSECRLRYGDYLDRRGVDNLTLVPMESGSVITLASQRWMVVSGNEPIAATSPNVDYLLVCRGFTGDVTVLAAKTGAARVMLSADLHRRRRLRYAAELTAAGVEVTDLSAEAHHLEF